MHAFLASSSQVALAERSGSARREGAAVRLLQRSRGAVSVSASFETSFFARPGKSTAETSSRTCTAEAVAPLPSDQLSQRGRLSASECLVMGRRADAWRAGLIGNYALCLRRSDRSGPISRAVFVLVTSKSRPAPRTGKDGKYLPAASDAFLRLSFLSLTTLRAIVSRSRDCSRPKSARRATAAASACSSALDAAMSHQANTGASSSSGST